MPRSTKILLLCCVSLFLFSCKENEREKQLDAREKLLSEKENIFSQKEAEFDALLKMRDSLYAKKTDSVVIPTWPEDILGKWTGKVICTESNCSDYVIGDQRTDIWEFVNDSLQTSVNVYSKNNLVRTYAGKLENNEIKLNFKTDSTSSKLVDMNILLNEISAEKIRGKRTITVNNNCSAVFSVELLRSSK
ncbi:hypothetical protein [Chryseobacterium sp. FH1]|uniref:hypothetical protein n=1 Tax=Chryseobacterium sp. FH1 TaxID=1233951 RepID=UPI0004E329CD|nr:hypothetical protein [Chryseobacterium sp. FH1]KFC20170.1 hypothetical protein IO90_13310 [Chryseobacterium sp. FH1]